MTTATQTTESRLDRYVELQRQLPEAGSFLRTTRADGLAAFMSLGFPTTSQEEWIYTNVAPIARTPFVLPQERTIAADSIAGVTMRDAAVAELVFVNGIFSAGLSSLGAASGLEITTFDAGSAEVASELLGRLATIDQPFVALNAALLDQGVVIRAPKGVVEAAPVHLIFVATPQPQAQIISPRILIVAEESSAVSVVETYTSIERSNYFTNSVTEVSVSENAAVDHTRVQLESLHAFHVSTVAVRQARSGVYASHAMNFGGGLVRNDIKSLLAGEGSDCSLDGLFVLDGRQHVDNHTVIDHATPHTTSNELYKGILDGESRGIFDGSIIVRKAAQKTASRQTNNNLLLSDSAIVDTKPQLEIYADDVKCNHGSTIGQLNEEALFYLQSRAIGADDARSLLTFAFASEVVGRIRIPAVRDQLTAMLLNRLPGSTGGRI